MVIGASSSLSDNIPPFLGEEHLIEVSTDGEEMHNPNSSDQEYDFTSADHNQQTCEVELETTIDLPFVGMEFESGEEAIKFYTVYAFKIGFSVRKASHYKARKKDNMITAWLLCCSKQGKTDSKGQRKNVETPQIIGTPQKNVHHRRTDCKAYIRVKLETDGKWRITKCETKHNHSLIDSPSKMRYCRSYRTITEEQKVLIHLLREQNIPTTQIMAFLAAREGGSQNLSFIQKDLNNEIAKRKQKLVGLDVATTLAYFEERKATDPLFYSKINFDDEGAARYIFWIDGRSRVAYKNFGDVITFDTTYMTNKYSMPFAPFIRVNHHWQSIFFGCALIRDEKADSFCWLFRTWLEAMSGVHPKAIITDQDLAMKKAIADVFPNTIHRCCEWHIMRKAREHLSVFYHDKVGFEDEFKSCIDDSLTIDEFDSNWKEMIVKHEMDDNTHLKHLYKCRAQWVPAFFRDTFFAGMSSSQRSESMNALIKIWMDCQESIYTFVIRFEKILESRFAREDEEDYRTIDGKASLCSRDPIEFQAREAYTRNIFSEFKESLQTSSGYNVFEMENPLVFNVRTIHNPFICNQRMLSYIVEVNESKSIISCNCKKFEFEGLLCPHVLKVMNHVNMHYIPSRYILTRWTKNAKEESMASSTRSVLTGESLESKALRFKILSSKVMKLVSQGSHNFEAFEMTSTRIDTITDEIAIFNESMKKLNENINEETESAGGNDIVNEEQEVREVITPKDPPESQCKGKRKAQRWKPQSERKQRKCGKCGKLGHYFTTCKEGRA